VENMSYATCPECGAKIEIFGLSQAAYTATELRIPLLGQIPLDSELSRHCDVGKIEEYDSDAFKPIVEQLVQRLKSEGGAGEKDG
jgi:hypothetical protein